MTRNTDEGRGNNQKLEIQMQEIFWLLGQLDLVFEFNGGEGHYLYCIYLILLFTNNDLETP